MNKPLLIASLVVTAAVGCAAPAQHAQTPQHVALACNQLPADSQQVLESVLAPGATFAAKPINEVRVRVRASQEPVLVGAEVQLPAPQNLSKEYLERVLTCHARTSVASHDADPFHPAVGRVSAIDVRSEGGTLAVQIRGTNKEANRDILQRAQRLATPASDVTIEQVGNTEAASRF